jgi:hypothetical protein
MLYRSILSARTPSRKQKFLSQGRRDKMRHTLQGNIVQLNFRNTLVLDFPSLSSISLMFPTHPVSYLLRIIMHLSRKLMRPLNLLHRPLPLISRRINNPLLHTQHTTTTQLLDDLLGLLDAHLRQYLVDLHELTALKRALQARRKRVENLPRCLLCLALFWIRCSRLFRRDLNVDSPQHAIESARRPRPRGSPPSLSESQ